MFVISALKNRTSIHEAWHDRNIVDWTIKVIKKQSDLISFDFA